MQRFFHGPEYIAPMCGDDGYQPFGPKAKSIEPWSIESAVFSERQVFGDPNGITFLFCTALFRTTKQRNRHGKSCCSGKMHLSCCRYFMQRAAHKPAAQRRVDRLDAER